jgi:RNA polymerase sigma-70 factor (ECF subfamily)
VESAESGAALASLFRREREPLRRFLVGLLRHSAEADDVLQQVFLKLVDAWATIRLDTARSWMFTVAYHEALARRRQRKRQAAILEDLWARPAWAGSRPPESPDDGAMRHEAVAAVRRALAKLPEPQRDVVERRMYQNQTFAAIAAELDCPLGTVLTRMRLALQSLAQILEKEP